MEKLDSLQSHAIASTVFIKWRMHEAAESKVKDRIDLLNTHYAVNNMMCAVVAVVFVVLLLLSLFFFLVFYSMISWAANGSDNPYIFQSHFIFSHLNYISVSLLVCGELLWAHCPVIDLTTRSRNWASVQYVFCQIATYLCLSLSLSLSNSYFFLTSLLDLFQRNIQHNHAHIRSSDGKVKVLCT